MKTQLLVGKQERIDDIPLLIGVLRQMNVAEVLDKHLGRHHLHRGLSWGDLAVGWLAYILSQGDRRKSAVQDWAGQRHLSLQTLLGCPLRTHEFSDDRLGIFLDRLACADWHAIETDLFLACFSVYQFPTDCVRLDSTTSCGYHSNDPDGLMQLGHSKDHRPDLPQLKVMAAVSQPLAFPLSTAIVPGNRADDELYWPAILNVKAMLKSANGPDKDKPLLFCGDRKMASLETRGRIARASDLYLTVLPHTGTTAKLFDSWVDQALQNEKVLTEVRRTQAEGKDPVRIARGYEFTRRLSTAIDGEEFTWSERVQVLQSACLFDSQKELLEKRLVQAETALWALTAPGKGRRVWRQEKELRSQVSELLQSHCVEGLLDVRWRRKESRRRRSGKSGRPKKGAAVRMEVEVRLRITEVGRNEGAIEQRQRRLGWYAQVTNAKKKRLTLATSVLVYREGAGLERPFHQLKDTPLGIRPLFVQRDEQVKGLTQLLLVALRVLTLVEVVVRAGLEATGEKLEGLYQGQKNKKEGRPTAKRLLAGVARLQLTLTEVVVGEEHHWHLTTLPPLLLRILGLLRLSPSLYTDLPKALSVAGRPATPR